MFILITTLLLFATALTLALLHFLRPDFRFAWLLSVGLVFLALVSVLLWLTQLPISLTMPSWQVANLFSASPSLLADGLSWPYALSLVILAIAILLTASAREGFPDPIGWALSLTLCGLGLLAVTANNPLTLVLAWAAVDLTEVVIMLWSVNGRVPNERTVIAFSLRAAGIVLVLMAQVIGNVQGKTVDFVSLPPQAGLLLIVAAGLRLGVLPVHLPYSSESPLRRGLGTMLRLVSAASSLVLLTHIHAASLSFPLTPILSILTCVAAVYGGWMWLRAPDEITGRSYWIIGLGSLAVASALRGNPAGATAWGVALVLAGGALFLASVQQIWLNRVLLITAWAISSLPFSLTAAGWQNNSGSFDFTLPVFIVAQAFLIAGLVRHALRPSLRAPLETQPVWAKRVYPAGIGILLFVQLLLGFWGWDGAFQLGVLVPGIAASLLSLGLLWAIPRFPVLNPVPAHWLQPSSTSRLDQLYQILWGGYRWLGNISQTISQILEGEGGIMWVLLFLILFVSLIVQRKP
jgi:hypothetical protein